LTHQLPTPRDPASLGNMKLQLTAIYIFSIIARVFAANSSQPSVEVIVTPYSSGVKIDVHVELAYSQSDSNSNSSASASSITPSANGATKIVNVTHTACGSHGHPTTHSTLKLPPAVTTQGFFLNSTGSPAATRRLQSPSLIDLTAFSAASSREGQPVVLSVVVIATVAMAVV
jgi:hypothetical protein